jgi:hypothetical protein
VRYWGTYWTPAGDEALIDTGRSSYDGNAHAYLLFTHHPYVVLHIAPFDLGSSESDARYLLIVDRETREVFAAGIRAGRKFLRAQHPPLPAIAAGDLDAWLKNVLDALASAPRPTPEQIQQRILAEYAACTRLRAELDELMQNALHHN